MDYSKLTQRDIEEKATKGSKLDERDVKRAGFERRIDRVRESMEKAKDQKSYDRFKEIEKYSIEKYNKYKF